MQQEEKNLIAKLGSEYFTVEHVEHWINRNDNVFINAPAALIAMEAKGFYAAVQLFLKRKGDTN